jgi:hypothetical protein
LVYSQPRNIFVKRDVKLTEPPDAEPHVRWCERSAAKAVSYSIKRIKQDKKHPGVLIKLRKSVDIAYFVRDKVITMNELEGFSEDLIDAVKLILSR